MIPAAPLPDRSRYEVWAPAAGAVEVRIDGEVRPLSARGDGWWELPGVRAVPGSRYAFRLCGDGEDRTPWLPDPRSMRQEDGVHADSTVVDPASLAHEEAWGGIDLRGAVLYELHVGTFAPRRTADGGWEGGTFDSAIGRLDALVELGVQAIEIMPVATFPGDRGWGYDGVGLYAVHEAYGGPEGLARLVAAAHARGLGVVLDVVHNHLGPAGNHLSRFGPYFTSAHETPWGEAVNLDGPGSAGVRAFLLGAVHQWFAQLHLDGLRLDAVHELHDTSPVHLLADMAQLRDALADQLGRPLALIAESDRNDPATVTPVAADGLGMDMQWADDVHHGVHAWITGEREGYYADFGSSATLAKVLSRAFAHDGGWSSFRGRPWGTPVDPASEQYDAHSFVVFLQDHDQVGNRAAGDRIHARLTPARHAAAIAPILLGAFTPMLFQGEEWAASTPFAYFTDHDPELGRLVTQGRTAEFARMGWRDAVPDPQARSTFVSSMLRWEEASDPEHAPIRDWHRILLALRREQPALREPDLRRTRCEVLDEDTILLRRGVPRADGDLVTVLVHRGEGGAQLPASDASRAVLLASSEAVLAGRDPADAPLRLAGPGALVIRSAGPAPGRPAPRP